ncbi:hypothetical protein DL765_009981 [Monosporascus sp. GIB2]|nr:hypothetical protein DL765_009981 [Monosporascus sp. GIB2]
MTELRSTTDFVGTESAGLATILSSGDNAEERWRGTFNGKGYSERVLHFGFELDIVIPIFALPVGALEDPSVYLGSSVPASIQHRFRWPQEGVWRLNRPSDPLPSLECPVRGHHAPTVDKPRGYVYVAYHLAVFVEFREGWEESVTHEPVPGALDSLHGALRLRELRPLRIPELAQQCGGHVIGVKADEHAATVFGPVILRLGLFRG